MFNGLKPDYDLIYKVVCGVGLPMRVYLPKCVSDEKKEAVLCIHGGGWRGAIKDNSHWDGSWMDNHAQYYAEKGKIGIAISYRDLDISPETVTKDQIEDCIDAISYIKRCIPEADFEKLYIIGDSAGAHLALCVGFLAPDNLRPRKIAACNPVTDLTAESWKDTGKTIEERKEISPLYMIDRIDFTNSKKPEILCMHGDKDTVVPIEDTVLFEKKLQKKGFKSQMITVPDASHAFILWGYTAKDEDVMRCMKTIDKFFFE